MIDVLNRAQIGRVSRCALRGWIYSINSEVVRSMRAGLEPLIAERRDQGFQVCLPEALTNVLRSRCSYRQVASKLTREIRGRSGIQQAKFYELIVIILTELILKKSDPVSSPNLSLGEQCRIAFRFMKTVVEYFMAVDCKAWRFAEGRRGVQIGRTLGLDDDQILEKIVTCLRESLSFKEFQSNQRDFISQVRSVGSISSDQEVFELFLVLVAHVLFEAGTL